MLSMYPAIFYEEKEGGYSVIFPDLNHLATCGDTLEDAMAMAVDCLANYLYIEKMEGNDVPAPTPLEKVEVHCEDSEGWEYVKSFVNLVSVDVNEYARQHFDRPVRKNVTIPYWLNETAKQKNINFSKVLQNALLAELNLKNK